MTTQSEIFVKSAEDRAVKRSISMPRRMLLRSMEVARSRGFSTLSDYLQHLQRQDHAQTATN